MCQVKKVKLGHKQDDLKFDIDFPLRHASILGQEFEAEFLPPPRFEIDQIEPYPVEIAEPDLNFIGFALIA